MSSRFRFIVAIGMAVSLFAASLSAAAQGNDIELTEDNGFEVSYDHEFATPEFFGVWERTDYPVQQLEVARTWIWGPGPITDGILEEYEEADDGERLVQYFDKSRMEEQVPGSAAAAEGEDSPWIITQGLLATELLTGQLQLGDDEFENHDPADIYIAGDWQNNQSPTYAAMGEFVGWEPRPTGSVITQAMDEDGNITDDLDLAEYGVTDAHFIEQTQHNIASVFWDFMQSEGLVYVDGDFSTGPIFLNEFYAIGYPITEAYWGWVTVDGVDQNVLIQCFERRCLTFAPDNPEGWEVESGNIGLHYYMWRYHQIDRDDPVTEITLELDPVESTNDVGTEHTLTATIMENGTPLDIEDAEDVSISVTRTTDEDDDDGENGVSVDVNETIEVEDGVATISYTGPNEPAVDTIEVTVDYNDEDLTATATKTWTDPVVDPEISITLDPEEATNPYFGSQGIEAFEAEIEAWVIAEYNIEHGDDAWDDLTEGQQQDILDQEIEDFWMTALGHEAPNHHTVEAVVTEDGSTVETGSVQVLIEVDGNGAEVFNQNVAIENGVAEIHYDATGHGSSDSTTIHNIQVTYEGESETATKTWVPFADFDYDAEPTYLILEHYEDPDSGDPALPVNEVGTWHDTIATLLDQFGQPIEGENLTFSIDGPNDDPNDFSTYDPADYPASEELNPEDWEGETNEFGQRAFAYVGETVGDDTLRVDLDDNDLFAELTKTWEAGEAFGFDLTIGDQQEDVFGSTGQFPMSYRELTVQIVDEFGNDVETDVAVTFEADAANGQFFDFPDVGHQDTHTVNTDAGTGSATVQFGANPQNYPPVLNVDVDITATDLETLEESFELVNPNPPL